MKSYRQRNVEVSSLKFGGKPAVSARSAKFLHCDSNNVCTPKNGYTLLCAFVDSFWGFGVMGDACEVGFFVESDEGIEAVITLQVEGVSSVPDVNTAVFKAACGVSCSV